MIYIINNHDLNQEHVILFIRVSLAWHHFKQTGNRNQIRGITGKKISSGDIDKTIINYHFCLI